MSDVVIRAEGLGKKYLIGHQSERRAGGTLRDMLTDTTRGLLRSARDMAAGRQLVAGDEVEEFWALKDINFEIKRGEVVGIIGRNGAGKSTLLKVLSRITEPTEGRVEIKGRVASLLEVGTGFHPELTGRENIYLNGAILGMSREEIRRKFDEIVDFSGVEKFLDTPVKRYSSGMYVRLAFAVAAHLEPEILIVDEVLAVGDAEFQKKSLGKMQDVTGEGRTVLFVSHNMAAIHSLCQRSLLVRGGRINGDGATGEIIRTYASSADDDIVGATYIWTNTIHQSNAFIGAIRSISLHNDTLSHISEMDLFSPFIVRMVLELHRPLSDVYVGFSFVNQNGHELMGTTARDGGIDANFLSGTHVLECNVDPNILLPGRYYIRASLFQTNNRIDHIDLALKFRVTPYVSRTTTIPRHFVGDTYVNYNWRSTMTK